MRQETLSDVFSLAQRLQDAAYEQGYLDATGSSARKESEAEAKTRAALAALMARLEAP